MPRRDLMRREKTQKLHDPYIAAGDHAYVIGTQDGGFPDMGWHTPGEMGGVWAHPVKLLDSVWVAVDGVWLEEADRFVCGPCWNEHHYALPTGLRVTRRQFVPDGVPAVVMRWTLMAPRRQRVTLRVLARTDLRGVWLSEVNGVHEGYDHARYDEDLQAWIAHDDCNPWCVVVGALDGIPATSDSGRDLWGPERTAGRGVSVVLDYDVETPADGEVRLDLAVVGSLTGAEEARALLRRMRRDAADLWEVKSRRYERMLGRSALDVPEPSLMGAWDWIKCNNDWLVRAVEGQGRGIGAGVQDYPWWFGCDSAYAIRGCLALGQHDIAVDTLDLLRTSSVRANGQTGRVIHESSTCGAVFNPGNTQETPHFVRTVWDTFRWTGDLAFLRRNYAICRRGLLEWTLGDCCPDGDVLPHGYGIMEVEGLNLCCVDTATLTVEALAALGAMAELLGDGATAARCRDLYPIVRRRLDKAFWIEGEGMYGDVAATPAEMIPRLQSWAEHAERPQAHGQARPHVAAAYRDLLAQAVAEPDQDTPRPWLLGNCTTICPLEAGLADDATAARVLDRVEGPEFSGRWGMYLNALDRAQSMSISTGVLTVAEAAYGRVDKALTYIRLLTDTLDMQMPGSIAEMSPDYGCFVQAWSGYGIAWPLVVGIFGLRPDAFHRRLTLRPQFPAGWTSASLRNVCVGDNSFDVTWDGRELRVTSQRPGWAVECATLPLRVE